MNGDVRMTFWDHLEALRGTILRSFAAVTVSAIIVFCFKSIVFDGILLWPTRTDFPFYRLTGSRFSMELVNYEMSAQFFVHLRVSFISGLILACPYVLFEFWKFIVPALYEKERKAAKASFLSAALLFYAGIAVGYFLILPLVLEFFMNYKVSDHILNTISLKSYISTFTSLVFVFGLVFEYPAVTAMLSRLGVINRSDMVKARKYAVVAILIVSAIITPADPLSMVIAAIPLYLLYEGGILLCGNNKK